MRVLPLIGGLALAASLLVPAGVWARTTTPAGSSTAAASTDELANVELPPALGQTDLAVFVPATGHTLAGAFLDYWRATGAAAVFGNPISEPFAAGGLYSQAFEGGVFQFHPDLVWTDEPFVRLMPLGQTALADRTGGFRADGKRAAGGGDRRASAWNAQAPDDGAIASTVADGGRYVEATGHTITAPFLAWYDAHEGAYYLGNPLSEPLQERGLTVQWFESGLLMAVDGQVVMAPLGRELAPRLGIDTTPVLRGDLPNFAESLFWTGADPFPASDLSAPGGKRIEVSLSQQRLWAYQGDTLVLTSLVSTGLDPNPTEQGSFRIRYKLPIEDMKGFTNATGEVVGFEGDEKAGGIPYDVPDVPNVMYFDMDGEALHGAYWHNNFGNPMSHGCINLPLDVAAFLYGWAPLGTPVTVHE